MGKSLSNMSKVGGWAGSGDTYSFLFTRAQPLFTVLSSAAVGTSPSVAAAANGLASAMQAVSAPLAHALGWEKDTAGESDEERSVHTDSDSVPWPTGEDAAMEVRERNALRPTALLQAVLFADATVIGEALRRFRTAVANSSWQLMEGFRAACVAAARYGTNEDYEALFHLWDTTPRSSPRSADLLFGISAGPADAGRCSAGIQTVRNLTTPDDSLAALVDVLNYAPHCRELAWTTYVATAHQLWKEAPGPFPAASTKILAGFMALSSESELQIASEMLDHAVFDEMVDRASADIALTRVRINIDMVKFNSGPALNHIDSSASVLFV